MVSQLSVDEVADLLKNEGFKENVVKLFVENEVDGEALLLLEKREHLNRIGLVKLGDIVKFEMFISRLRESSTTEDAPALTGPSQTRVSEKRQDERRPDATPNPSRRAESSSVDLHDHKPMFHITFNAIVSGKSWGWDDSSELYILFQPPELGGMKDCYRWKTKSRDTGDSFYAVKGTLQMPFKVVQKYGFIYYTYAAKTSQTNGVQNEHLWNVKSRKWNGCRCLKIPLSEKKPGGVWEHWDTIVYPKGTVTFSGVLVSVDGNETENFSKIRYETCTDEQITNIDPEDEESVVARCLSIYLHSYKKKLQSCDIVATTSGISQMIYSVEQIFNQLQHRLIGLTQYDDRTCYFKKDWSSQKLISIMERWTMNIVHTLRTDLDKCTPGTPADGSFLMSAITVLCIVHEVFIISQLSEQDCVAIALLLRESYKAKNRTCSACATLVKHLQETEFRCKVVTPALRQLAVTIILKSNDKNWQWLYVVPLYHFMAGLSSPNEPIPLDRNITWKFWNELEGVRKKQQSNSYMCIMMSVMDLMDLDYMFTIVMLYMCPHKNLVVVLQKVDPILATSFYIWYVDNHGKDFLKAKDSAAAAKAVDLHLKALAVAHIRLPDEDWMLQRKYSKLKHNAYMIMKGVLDALTGTSENQCQILHHLIDYVIFVISEKFKKQHADEAIVSLEELDENDWPAKPVELIGEWLQKVIGHSKFGGALSKQFGDEVYVWKVLFTSKESSYGCTQMFWEHWIIAIEQLLERRIKPVENKTKLVSCLEAKEHIPHQVCEVIIRLTTDDLMSSTDVELSIKIDDLATQRQSFGNVGKILSRILTKHLEKLTKEKNIVVLKKCITINELIEWKVWSNMLKVANGDEWTELCCSMTEFAKEACKTARNTLQVHCDQVVAGDVTLYDMEIFKQNQRTVDHLCTAACIREFSLQYWLGRLEDVSRYIEKVQQFHNLLDQDVQDYKSLEEKLHNVLRKPMKELYYHWNDSHDCDFGYKCCPTIQPCILTILGSFYLLATTGKTEIFCYVWKENLSSLMSHHNCAFTQEDMVNFVWKPTFEYYMELIARLRRGITLSEVERIFCNVKTDLQSSCASVAKSSSVSYSVPEDLIIKFCTCECCTTQEIQQHFTSRTIISSELEWIETVYKRIQHYRLSLECAQAVFTLCDKDHSNLTGNFNSIHGFIEKDSKKLTNFYLCDICNVTDPLLGDLQGLSTITDITKVQCLKSLINCWKLVEWIKKFQSIDAFYAYVELIALDATDADTALLLSDVRTVGNAINKLLFQLPEPCGLNDLVTACDDFCSEESFYQKLLQSQQAIVSLSKQLGQQLETAAIQEVDSLSRKLDHECHQTATMKQEIDSLSTTLSQERHQLATVKQEKFNLETISQEQSKQLDIALSKLKDLEQQHAMLEESFHQATEIGRANEAMIEKLKEELSTANNETQYYKENYCAEKRDKEQTAEELETIRVESTETINRLSADREASNRLLEAKNTELNNLEEQFSSVSQTLSRLRKVDNIEGLHEAKEIGRGSYGAVYEVRVNSVPCIAKRVHDILVGRGQEEPVGDEESMAIVCRFHEECNLLSTLHHPNVVQFMGVHYGHDEADISLIMEHMHMDLEHCMKTYSDIPLPYKTSILRDVAYGLAYLHSIPIIHRDLNTGNILLTESLRAKVADLGVSKLFDRKVMHTRSKVPGAMDFMPPECFDESPKYDDKLDIFSFGHLTICLVNQKSPLVADKNITQEDVANGQVQVAKRRESLSRMGGIYSIAVQCLSDNPDRRPTSTELVEMLEDTCKQYPVAHKNPLDALASKRQEIIRQSTEMQIERLQQICVKLQSELNEQHHGELNTQLEALNETHLQDAGQRRISQLSHRNTQERRPRIT